MFVAEDGAARLGFAAILPRDDGDLELDGLFVDPVVQRRGAGLALVEHCAKVGRASGAGALHVVGNPHAAEFYAAAGFVVTGSFQTRFGPGILMQKLI